MLDSVRDGASVNIGVHKGVGTQLMAKPCGFKSFHCFNHRVELALKDKFTIIHSKNVEEMLLKLYFLYQKRPNCKRELRESSEVYD